MCVVRGSRTALDVSRSWTNAVALYISALSFPAVGADSSLAVTEPAEAEAEAEAEAAAATTTAVAEDATGEEMRDGRWGHLR